MNAMRLFRRRSRAPGWIFAEDVLSAVTYAECARLAELARGARVLEVGSYYGRSTVALASVSTAVHAVDPHEGGPSDATRTLDDFLANLDRYGVRDRVVVHVGRSTQVLPMFRDGGFSLVFIDAMHQRPDVDVDLVLSARCLEPGGCLALHDYGLDGVQVGDRWEAFGVTEALHEFVELTGAARPEVVDTLAVIHAPDEEDGLRVWHAGVAAFAEAIR